MPESTDATETITLSEDTEQKTRNASTKVTLVKPMQPEAENMAPEDASIAAEAVPAKKQSPRPKVGRSGATRKKKSENGEQKIEQKSEQTEKKAGKSKSKPENVAVLEQSSQAKADKSSSWGKKKKSGEQVAAKTEVADESAQTSVEQASPSQKLRVEQLQEELAKMELPPDWEVEHSRPWSFPLILLIVALFMATSWALATIANNYHKTKNTAPISTADASPAAPAQPGEYGAHDATKPATNGASVSSAVTPSPAGQSASVRDQRLAQA